MIVRIKLPFKFIRGLIIHGGGAETSVTARFRLESNLKIGQFSFTEQDLVLPVNGIPLNVTRTYNSFNLNRGGKGSVPQKHIFSLPD